MRADLSAVDFAAPMTHDIDGPADPWTSVHDWARVSAGNNPSRRYESLNFAVVALEMTIEEKLLFSTPDSQPTSRNFGSLATSGSMSS
jgi:hypothetical protein